MGDTLSAIAARFGVTIDALRAANPTVQELFLHVGQTLTIPLALSTPTPLANSTPVPLEIAPPQCYPSPTGSLWCLTQVRNPGPDPVEEISVAFFLRDEAGGMLASGEASPPLDLLLPGKALPVAAFFPSQPDAGVRAEARLRSALVAQAPEKRYLPLEVLSQKSADLEGGIEVLATVQLSPSSPAAASHARFVLALYNGQGGLVGLRQETLEATWLPGEKREIRLQAYALQGDIASHDLLLEALP